MYEYHYTYMYSFACVFVYRVYLFLHRLAVRLDYTNAFSEKTYIIALIIPCLYVVCLKRKDHACRYKQKNNEGTVIKSNHSMRY